MRLNRKRARFVSEYLKDCNATQAAMRAGYSQASAHAQGCRLLKYAEVAEAIRQRSEEKAMSADEVLAGLADIARNAEKHSDRVSALGLLGKHHKLFTDKLEHSGALGVKLEDFVPKRRRNGE